MKRLLAILFFLNLGTQVFGQSFSLSAYKPVADGKTDDTPAFQRLFTAVAKAGGGTVTIPVGNYFLKGDVSIPVSSNTTVSAYGARFFLPKVLGDQARIVAFSGADIQNFSWFGGYFEGYCFDHRNPPNTWEPNVTTRMILITTTAKGKTDNLLFRDIQSSKIAGAVVTVLGLHREGSESEVVNFATNVTVENCTLLESGKFMWDYGLLWQILVWPEDYTPADIAMAKKYFRNDVIRSGVSMADGTTEVRVANTQRTIPVSQQDSPAQTVCFYGDKLPANILRGRKYYVVNSAADHLQVSETFGGKPIAFSGSAGPETKLIYNLQSAFFGLYAPLGAGPGKGCIDLVACKNTRITGCKISALGDAMHIHSSHNNVFSNNQILGARMGAFFLAEYCKNSTITGNTVDGTNGSRIVSIERSNEDVTVIGNTFRNGGRGSWINQPKNLLIQGNVFINNTTKCEQDPWHGRRSFHTGEWESYPEIYFTTWQAGGKYGPVILKDNIFETGPQAKAAIEFLPNGYDVIVEGNMFKGTTGKILVGDQTEIAVGQNRGATVEKAKPGTRIGNN
ncbi:right-handed parallel beta-helix repeat-containing protein [Larkinella bovis]|uniref:Right-handed parallel beta-helix repeat-containing protein n=1 Tax=Larkinella bovis TaxID=683041 RepID=A0ABW0IAB3_9BACT